MIFDYTDVFYFNNFTDSGFIQEEKSFVSEQSLGTLAGNDGGSVIIHSLVESRYRKTIEMRVLSSIAGPFGSSQTDQNYCFF